MIDREVKKRAKTLTGIGQRMVNQEDPSSKTREVMPPEMIEESKDVSDVAKRATLKETAW